MITIVTHTIIESESPTHKVFRTIALILDFKHEQFLIHMNDYLNGILQIKRLVMCVQLH
jgi:hypothetical protein